MSAALAMCGDAGGGLLAEIEQAGIAGGCGTCGGLRARLGCGLLFKRENVELCGAHVFQTETHFQ
jgi:hypothetical protein